MINNHKITTKQPTAQVAGLMPGDSNIEFIGVKKTQQVLWLQNGHTLDFKYLPKWAYRICQEKYLNDKPAIDQLSKLTISEERQVELYIYHMYGDLDTTADILNGKLTPSENFRHSKNDASLNWDHKWITIDNKVLTPRDLKIIDLIIEDAPDKAIAAELGITQSTLDFHKRKLYERAGVCSKMALIIKAFNQHI
jgi:DNA-binding CsgD family transcriptional regulator